MKTLLVAAALRSPSPPTADAATWKQVTADGGANIDQVGRVRTADGVLHVVWHKDGDLFHTAIGAEREGRARRRRSSRAGPATRTPRIVAVPGGLRAFWGGDPLDRPERAQPGPEHGVLARRRRVLAAAAGLGRPARLAVLRERRERGDAPERDDAAGAGGDARHVGARGAGPGDAELQLPGRRQLRLLPGDRRGRERDGDDGVVLEREARRGVLAQGVNADGSPAGPVLTMPGIAGDGRRRDGVAHADRRAGEERRVLRRLRARLSDRRTRCGCGSVGATSATLLDRTEAQHAGRARGGRQGTDLGRLERRHVRRAAGARGALEPEGDDVRPAGRPRARSRTRTHIYRSTRTRPARRSTCWRCSGSARRRAARRSSRAMQPGLTLKATQVERRDDVHGHRRGRAGEGREGQVRGRSGRTNAKGRVTLTGARARRPRPRRATRTRS